jgi:hypothetical protein
MGELGREGRDQRVNLCSPNRGGDGRLDYLRMAVWVTSRPFLVNETE